MCYQCDDYEITDQQLRVAEIIVEDFSYTLKKFGLVNRTIRPWWAQELEILLTRGKEAVEKHRYEMSKEWDNYN